MVKGYDSMNKSGIANTNRRKLPHEDRPGLYQDTRELIDRNARLTTEQLKEAVVGRKMTDVQRASMMISKLQEDKEELGENAKKAINTSKTLLKRVEELEKENTELKKKLNGVD